MYSLHLGPAFLLGLSSLNLTIALPTQDQNKITTNVSDVSAPTPSASEIFNTVETVALAGVPKLSPDNSCGNSGNGKNTGYTCDSKSIGGGACCSAYVSPIVFYFYTPLLTPVFHRGVAV
jgi:hypothetical protein